ncbi:MAG TPA: L-histidine N(alpha)-methyltransferase [Polyangia bacterium]|nr:L-histidine N(alpha)-methyltransferase [Polyangia bacterium]
MSSVEVDVLSSSGALDGGDADGATRRAVIQAAREGLLRTDKRLPAWLLYDARGSALFEQITDLPEYYPTRTERAILTAHAAEMVDAAGPPVAVAELGAGTASKTRLLLSALLQRQRGAVYVPIDVSPSALTLAKAALARFRRLSVHPVVGRYPEDLGVLDAIPGRRLLLFLGSNLGNYDPEPARALLAAVRARLRPGDAFLIGTDLRKSGRILVPAYDDAAGVTARFNKNILARLNSDVGGDFDLQAFRHVVCWNAAASRVELYLESLRAQQVRLRALGTVVPFAAGERIHTESSYKFTRQGVRALVAAAGFRWERSWQDERRWFAVHLVRVPAS